MLFQKPIIFLNKDGYNNKDEKGLCQNLMFSPTLGCLLGKYKLFGEKIFFLACKKNLYCPFLQILFYTTNSKKKLQYASNHKKWSNKMTYKCFKDSKTVSCIIDVKNIDT